MHADFPSILMSGAHLLGSELSAAIQTFVTIHFCMSLVLYPLICTEYLFSCNGSKFELH